MCSLYFNCFIWSWHLCQVASEAAVGGDTKKLWQPSAPNTARRKIQQFFKYGATGGRQRYQRLCIRCCTISPKHRCHSVKF